MKIKNWKLKIALLFIFFSVAMQVHATTGYIDATATNQVLVCQNVDCSSSSIIDFELTNNTFMVNDVTGLSGKVWGTELGWITFNPKDRGVYFKNVSTGLLSGYAWSTVSGWINFEVTGQQVIINPNTGEFNGYAWAGGPQGGWIKFDCTNPETCVRTTWRANQAPGGHPPLNQDPLDICPNIDGNQNEIPKGFYKEGDFCLFKTAEQTQIEQNTTNNVSGGGVLINTINRVKDVGGTMISKTITIAATNASSFWNNVNAGGSYVIKGTEKIISNAYISTTTYFGNLYQNITSFFGNLSWKK